MHIVFLIPATIIPIDINSHTALIVMGCADFIHIHIKLGKLALPYDTHDAEFRAISEVPYVSCPRAGYGFTIDREVSEISGRHRIECHGIGIAAYSVRFRFPLADEVLHVVCQDSWQCC